MNGKVISARMDPILRCGRGAWVLWVVCLLFCTSLSAFAGTTLVVTTANDDGGVGVASNCPGTNCSLRDALAAAASDSGPVVITFDSTVFPTGPGATAQTINLQGNTLDISSGDILIEGPGANLLTLNGHGSVAVMEIDAGATVSISGVSIDGGYGPVDSDTAGGIVNAGTLTVNGNIFWGDGSFSTGGAISNSGILTVTNSTFLANSGVSSGAISSSGTLTVTNSTFTQNGDGAVGSTSTIIGAGAIDITSGTATITNNTFDSNYSHHSGATDISMTGGQLTLADCIFSGGQGSESFPAIAVSAGSLNDEGYNVFFGNQGGNASGFNLASTDVTTGNTELAPLGYYGYPTETMPPQSGSSALNAGVYLAGEPTTDQRGAPRPSGVNTAIDSGAVQVSGNLPTISAVTPSVGQSGSLVTITGRGFYSASAVDFGTLPATSFVINSDTSITAVAPTQMTGTVVSVTVTTSSGPVTATDAYAYGAILTVTTAADDATGNAGNCPGSDCSLRDALAAAVQDGAGFISFDPSVFSTAQTINLNSTLDIPSGHVSIVGPGAKLLTLSGDNQEMVMWIGAGATVSLSGVTIANGNYGNAGAIENYRGTLTVANSTFYNNSGSEAGAIYNYSGTFNGSTLGVTNSTFYNNSSSGGEAGAIATEGGILGLTNSTFYNNSGSDAGAIYNFDGLLTVTNITFDDNSSSGLGYSGGISSNDGMTIADCIFSNNSTGIGDQGGIVNDLGYNVFYNNQGGNAFGFSLVSTDVTTGNTNLAALGYYGGSTETMPPLSGSSALDAGAYLASVPIPTTDQRGAPRPSVVNTAIDSGAVQVSGNPPMIGSVTPNSGPVSSSESSSSNGVPIVISGTGLGALSASGETSTYNANTYGQDAATALLNGSDLNAGSSSSTNQPPIVSFRNTKLNFLEGATNVVVHPAVGNTPAYITADAPPSYQSLTAYVTVSNSLGTSTPSNNALFTWFIPVSITPASTTFNFSYGVKMGSNLVFNVTGGSGAYILSNSGTLPTGLRLTTNTTSWTLSGTPTASGNYTLHLTATDSRYSTNAVTLTYYIDVTGGNKSNVTVTTPAPLSFVYGKTGTISMSLEAPASKNNIPTGTITYSIDDGPNQNVSLNSGQVSFTIPDTLALGTHQITWSYSGDENYNGLNNQSFSFIVVSAATLRITASNGSMIYGGTPPTITPSYSGFLNGDTAASLSKQPTCTSNATAQSPVGNTYVSSCSGAVDSNYSIHYINGAVTVNRAALHVTAANATRIYGTANPVLAGSLTGQVNNDTFTVSYSTTATQNSNVGNYAIVPSVTGVDLADYTVTPTNGTLSVTKASTATTVSASASSITPGQSLTLTATVTDASPGSTGTPAGTVSFYNGTTLLGTGTLNNGMASYTLSSPTPGTNYTFTASYAGDEDFQPSSSSSSSTVGVAPENFALTATGSTSQTIVPGGAASYSLQVNPTYGVYPGPVSFSATGLPTGATATFSPATLAASAGEQTVTMTIQTTSATTAANSNPFERAAPILLGSLLLPLLGLRRVRKEWKKRGLLIALLLLGGLASITTLTGCGTSDGFNNGQSSQTYTVSVTATSGAVSHTTEVSLNVQ